MSAPIVLLEGYPALMRLGLGAIQAGANQAAIRLWQNNLYPTRSTSWADFVECNFPGYAPLNPGIFTDLGLNSVFIDVWQNAQLQWALSALPGQVAYGYWLDFVNPTNGLRQGLWCQRFDVPFAFVAPGNFLPILLTPGFSQG